ncbi:hypothetical protein [Methylophilus aquaticus]|uniref:Uncharacterized protein n=1 Tax=Methylophilus aquaticus TaxID=1971610 RepID=A0ABT9JR97_9PROT|nr:hypothetical protein [Methylophilus aquaticus]MDP8567014.1 hypothetical protein [Methylophilus aquaticus]
MTDINIVNDAESYRHHFDNIFVGGIPKFFTEEAAFLSFVSMLTAIEALAGLMAPKQTTGERFQNFIKQYFPPEYSPITEKLWAFRNTMIHSFSPGDCLISCHTSRLHLKDVNGALFLNAENLFGAFLHASNAYFDKLENDQQLKNNFVFRINQIGGGAPVSYAIHDSRVS